MPESCRELASRRGCRRAGRVGARDRGRPDVRLAPNRAHRAEDPGWIGSGGSLLDLGVLEQPATDDYGRWKPVLADCRPANGRVVADSSHYLYPAVLKRLAWSPRACRSALTEVWDRRTWNQPGDKTDEHGLRARGDLVPPGRYRIEAGWDGLETRSKEIELAR